MTALSIVYMPVAELKPANRNARTHSKRQIRKIADSIKQWGFKNPVLCDADNRIVCGHGRLEAATMAGLAEVPVIRADDLSPEQLRAFAIAENKLSELGGWSTEDLKLELAELEATFDLTLTGFDTADIDRLLSDEVVSPSEDNSWANAELPMQPVSRSGDIWEIGNHRIICGDARLADTYVRLLGSERAQMVITDPPYNVKIDGHVSGLGSVKHREFEMASGEMTTEQFQSFLGSIMTQLTTFSSAGSVHFIFMDFRHMKEVLAAADGIYQELLNLCVWVKTNGGMGGLYRSQHELVFVFKAGKGVHINNIELGKHGRYRTNVWRYAGINSFGKNRDAALNAHPTVKPVDLVTDAILDCSKRKGIILDAFLGSGTTIVAAEQTGRRGFGIELDPAYVDVAVERACRACGKPAILSGTSLTFAQIKTQRQSVGGLA